MSASKIVQFANFTSTTKRKYSNTRRPARVLLFPTKTIGTVQSALPLCGELEAQRAAEPDLKVFRKDIAEGKYKVEPRELAEILVGSLGLI